MSPSDGSAFAGSWEDSEGALLDIDGSTVIDANGDKVELSFNDSAECVLLIGSESFCGKLSPDASKLFWDDGAVWVRKPSGAALQKERQAEALLASLPEPARRPKLTLEQVLELQRELEKSFADEGFQQRLREVDSKHGRAHVKYTVAHTELFLTVQNAVLPKYGFAEGQKGVLDMLEVGAQFNDSQEYRRQRDRLNQLLGLTPSEHERQEEQQQARAGSVRVAVRHYFDGTELAVVVPRAATFRELKEAISEVTGREEVLRKGHLVKKEGGVYSAHRDGDAIGAVRQVSMMGAELTVREGGEAEAWREQLRARIAARAEGATAPDAAREAGAAGGGQAYSSLAWRDIRPAASREPRKAPHGPCFVVGSWDDYRGRKEMEWDGCAYRCTVTLQAEEESFQILAGSTSWERRIYPSFDGASPLVQHRTLGPDGEGHGLNWAIRDPTPGTKYEVVLSCQRGRPMSMAWSKTVGHFGC